MSRSASLSDVRHPASPGALADRRFVLATDLDGTFLGGSDADRAALYGWIEANREDIGLIFVTGRDPAFLEELCATTPVPWPDYAVGDVGTTIARMIFEADPYGPPGRVSPIEALEAEIAGIWNDAGAAVREALSEAPGLTLQPTPFRHRVSYDYDPAAFDPAAHATVEAMGHDVLISDDRFFDVLPRGVSKGPSLKRLLDHLGVPHGRVLAAGDTLNDRSMLESGLPAVAVGNSEAPLLDALSGVPSVHRADAHGAGGILEAIAALDLHPSPPAPVG
jgi:hydroxymethylpyrimidine pyrophosphatase-like HAD family hydrolase